MNREWMLLMTRERIRNLKNRYYAACKDKDEHGNPYGKHRALTVRVECKKSIQILTLIEQLLLTSSAVWIEDEDACEGFSKLIEPKTWRKKVDK